MSMCKQSGGSSQKDNWGEVHTHVCGDDKGHGGNHSCLFCPYTW